jgi:hypothetical protein
MSVRRILLWVLVAVVVLALIAAGAWLFARAGYGSMGWFGFAGRGVPEGGRFFDMPRHYGMMPGYARGIGFPYLGWVGSVLVFALGVGVGLILAAIGRRPSAPQPSPAESETDVPASFEAWHNQLHEQEAKRPATRRSRRS